MRCLTDVKFSHCQGDFMITIPKGTKDALPNESYRWQHIEGIALETAMRYGFKEIRTPVFEHTELFLRGVGDTTDIVNKEMYTFDDKGGRSMTLKPEGTAGVARSFVENLQASTLPLKMFYLTPVFRYEKPQSGRLREHHQFGVELYGSDSFLADAEVISLAKNFFEQFGLDKLELNINSIGCPTCRKDYHKALKEYLGDNINKMCPTCRERFEKNPLRILDCKEEGCKKITQNAPKIIDYLCSDCKNHFDGLQKALIAQEIDFKINPMIVRGLDYYTRTVFEFVTNSIGAQGTVCGGGRYNGLVEEVGGKHTPAVGFGLGIERLLMVLDNEKITDEWKDYSNDLYIATIGENAKIKALSIANEMRNNGFSVDFDLMDKSIKAQMKYANKTNAKFVVVLGDDEIEKNKIVLKSMNSKLEREIEIEIEDIWQTICEFESIEMGGDDFDEDCECECGSCEGCCNGCNHEE